MRFLRWHDGVNYLHSDYVVCEDGEIEIGDNRAVKTLVGTVGEFNYDDVELNAVTRYEIKGDNLTLYTPRQIYELER